MNWHSLRWPLAVAVLALAGATWAGISYAADGREADHIAELERRFAAGASDHEPAPTMGELLSDLLQTASGRARLGEFAARHPEIAFDEARQAAYWVHDRERSEGKSCLGTVRLDGELPLIGHCGFTRQLRLLGVALAGDQLLVRVATAEDAAGRDPAANGGVLADLGLVAGRTYDAVIDLTRTRGEQLRDDHIVEYRPIAR